ncbi:Dsc2p SCDLUD_005069 [Saccharomycodes ludwigii]|uniref:Dsc2p n=1 Tax=Saccharomycodes ludwigii TaxID=36035 RepID=UPI001E87989E|nr:hypothetical protein SCDLUD_005069 [Saccharomycodes ludwigii]KAH3898741.1 hypothetical protein SCDLUD_005069 [Saccharomycodes ludwigii]
MKGYPVSQKLAILIILIPALFTALSPGLQKKFIITKASPYITKYNQFYRYLTFQLFPNLYESDILLCFVIFYLLQPLERCFGSKKYLSIIICLIFYNIILTGGIHLLWCKLLLNKIHNTNEDLNTDYGVGLPTGLISTLLGLLHFVKKYVPIKYNWEFKLGSTATTNNNSITNVIIFNDQFYLNIMYFLLILNNLSTSFFMFSSWCIGVLLDVGILPGMNWRIPILFNDDSNKTRRNLITRASSLNNTHYQPEEEEEDDDDEHNAEPPRPLAVQVLNTLNNS